MARHDKPSEVEEQLVSILRGAQQVLAGGETLAFDGASHDLASLTQVVEAVLARYTNVQKFRTLMEQSVDERRANEPEAKRVVNVIKHAAAAAFGEHSVEFSLLGFQPRKDNVELTPEQKQHKLEQMRATRLARHTMGKRQKRAVKGDASSKAGDAGPPATPTEGHAP